MAAENASNYIKATFSKSDVKVHWGGGGDLVFHNYDVVVSSFLGLYVFVCW